MHDWKTIQDSLEGLPLASTSSARQGEGLPVGEGPLFGFGYGDSSDKRLVTCNQCSKSILETAFERHLQTCASAPLLERRLSDASADSKKKKKGPAAQLLETLGVPTDDDKPKKKKDKKDSQAKPKRNKPGGPVDVNVQCGVINDKGLPCPRSLTCKTHAMGAKRSVPGRSDTYDVLLLEWQRKHNPQAVLGKKVVTPRVGPGVVASTKKKKSGLSSGMLIDNRKGKGKDRQIFGEVDGDMDGPPGDEEDSDSEVEQVFAGMERSYARPMVMGYSAALEVRTMKLARYRDALLYAFTGRSIT